jgi:hypothetical protein
MADYTSDTGLVATLSAGDGEILYEPVQAVEVEDFSDDEMLLAPAQDWFEDLMEQCVPGSVVLLIVLVLLAKPIFETINNWITRKSNG